MRTSALLVCALVAGTGVAGCLVRGPGAPAPTSGPFRFLDPMTSVTAAHDHADVRQHMLSQNMSQVSHLALTEQEGETAQSHSIDFCDHWVVLGREATGTFGVDIVDVKDPSHPVWVGKYRDENAAPGDRDVAWSADCGYVFMGNQGNSADSSGVRVINTQDKAAPRFESLYRIAPSVSAGLPVGVGGGVHSVYARKVGSDQFVYALNYGVHILKVITGPDGKQTLTPAGKYITADAAQLEAVNAGGVDTVATRRTIYAHDMAVYVDGGKTIMYVAYAYDGLRIVDITNPAVPTDIAHWVPSGAGAPHYVHNVKTYARPNGQRITIAEAETFEDRNTDTPSPIWFLDTTDLAQPKLLSTWTNPGGHGADHLLFSTHNFEVENDVVWLTHYHGGVWTLDASDPAHPVVAGYYLPHEDTGYKPAANCCIGFKLAGIPMTFDIKVHGGIAYAADYSTGLYALTRSA